VVSGVPRSGTSLMMQMLVAGGMTVLSDGLRAADEDNPRGYYELEAVKRLRKDGSWLAEAGGKVVKVVSSLLCDLPPTRSYRVIFMLRPLDEVLASQKAMLRRRGEQDEGPPDSQMRSHFESHLAKVRAWLQAHPGFRVLYCHYGELIEAPEAGARRVVEFLGKPLDVAAMVRAVDPGLHRNRAAGRGRVGGA
jgi:hypothetical protein